MNKELNELLLNSVKDIDKDTSFGVIPDLLNILNGDNINE